MRFQRSDACFARARVIGVMSSTVYWLTTMLSLFVGGMISAESMLYVLSKKGFKFQLLLAVAIALLAATAFFINENSYAYETKKLLLFCVNLFSFFVPLLLLSLINLKIVSVVSTSAKHSFLALAVLAICISWPFFVVILTCYSGLDCL